MMIKAIGVIRFNMACPEGWRSAFAGAGGQQRVMIACKQIRSGGWVNGARLRSYPLILLGVWLTIAVWALAFGHGLLDAGGRPLGTDFLSFWSASSLLGQGRPADV